MVQPLKKHHLQCLIGLATLVVAGGASIFIVSSLIQPNKEDLFLAMSEEGYFKTSGRYVDDGTLIRWIDALDLSPGDSWKGTTLLEAAAMHGRLEVVKSLIERNSSRYYLSGDNNILFAAANEPDVLEFLLHHGGDPTLLHPSGESLPIWIAKLGNSRSCDALRRLAAYGGKNLLLLENTEGQSLSVEHATVASDRKCIRLLLDH